MTETKQARAERWRAEVHAERDLKPSEEERDSHPAPIVRDGIRRLEEEGRLTRRGLERDLSETWNPVGAPVIETTTEPPNAQPDKDARER